MYTKPKIVVLGAGYAGMVTTKRLTQLLSAEEAEIVLVNKHNYHYESTWLHEVAAGTINPNQARVMISDVINPNRVRLVYDAVVKVDKDNQRVELENGELDYDILVFALGFESNTFGIKGMKENAFAIEDIDSSRQIRDHIEYQFSRYNNSPEKDDASLAILVGGGGFTGIEFVGELSERVPELCKKYDIDRSKVRIINVEAGPTILPGFDEELVAYGKKSLEDRGVEFRLGAKISECTEEGFIVNDDELIKAGTVVWTGGVTGNSVLGNSGFELFRGKVNVNSDLRDPSSDHVFILGDCSWVMNEETGRPYPPTAQIAIQEADTAAANIKALLYGEPLQDFVFDNKGTVASLGKKDAMGTIFEGTKLYGRKAVYMKQIIDNRSLYIIGGPKLILKKGKFRLF
ncbi:NAD(P)/FAD-dependent oxidoreductase [Aciduricibacillus chroicocephali]|uniref:NAD(P)/FAD-dependent oxidoreductase n=1 Tax=Aciduricibacillus chroicocephali TaxID=3054939 RepID=A0ABY9KXN6_9BACI|nr:NAD(P)/FAD-dependent oxidoreductase [Bacillaceae bacterium 44XB]